MEGMMDNTKKNEVLRMGLAVFILLAFMTAGEFLVGAYVEGWAAPLWLIALIKAFLIIRDYMHLPRLFAGDEEGHS
jgi:TM2 domain-containing membrane protein YozV